MLHAEMSKRDSRSISINDELEYINLIRSLAIHQLDHPECVQSGRRLVFFPMPGGVKTNSLWAEFVFRLYSCVLRVLQFSLMHDGLQSTHGAASPEQTLDIDERKNLRLQISSLIAFMNWEQTELRKLEPGLSKIHERLALPRIYLKDIKILLEAYSIWNLGCLSAIGLCESKDALDLAGTLEDPASARHDEFARMTHHKTREMPVSRGYGARIDTLDDDRVHLMDRLMHSRKLAPEEAIMLQTIVHLFYTCYQRLLECKSVLVPLTGSRFVSQLSLFPDENAMAYEESRTSGQSASPFVYTEPELLQSIRRSAPHLVMHNAPSDGRIVLGDLDDVSLDMTSGRASTGSWLDLAMSQFMVWLARLLRYKGMKSAEAVMLHTAKLNGAYIPGYSLMIDACMSGTSSASGRRKTDCRSLIREFTCNNTNIQRLGILPERCF